MQTKCELLTTVTLSKQELYNYVYCKSFGKALAVAELSHSTIIITFETHTNKYSQFKFQLKSIIPGFETKLIYCSDSSDEVILRVFWSILSFFKDCFHLKTEIE